MERRKTILICDDEPALRELIRASMDDGYEFAEASDGIIAMELAKELSPDMVILDLMLPRLSGLEVLARLNDDEELEGRPRPGDHRVERDARGRARRRGGRVRDEAVRPGGVEDCSQEAGGRVNRRRSISLRDRMLVASILLAALVVGVFVALILAVSAARTATKQETHSKDVTTAALGLQRTLLEVETGARGYALSGNRHFIPPYYKAVHDVKVQSPEFRSLVTDQPEQRRLAFDLTQAIDTYITDFANPVVQVFSNRQAAKLAARSTGRESADDDQAELHAVSHN